MLAGTGCSSASDGHCRVYYLRRFSSFLVVCDGLAGVSSTMHAPQQHLCQSSDGCGTSHTSELVALVAIGVFSRLVSASLCSLAPGYGAVRVEAHPTLACHISDSMQHYALYSVSSLSEFGLLPEHLCAAHSSCRVSLWRAAPE